MHLPGQQLALGGLLAAAAGWGSGGLGMPDGMIFHLLGHGHGKSLEACLNPES